MELNKLSGINYNMQSYGQLIKRSKESSVDQTHYIGRHNARSQVDLIDFQNRRDGEFELLKVHQTKNIENENFKIRFKKIFKNEIYKN
jgi:hypothetical protein